MASRSIVSSSTVRTVDDVMSQLDTSLSRDTSLADTRAYVRRITGQNEALATQSIDELHNLESLLSIVTSNPPVLVSSMLKYNVILGGPQATSFFYPICEFTDSPWDFFCRCDTADAFIASYRSSSGADFVEEVRTEDGPQVLHFRRNINGSSKPAKIRIYVSDKEPMQSILLLKHTYEQTAVSAVGAICFWPKLQRRGLYRVFNSNDGLKDYPRGRTQYEIEINPGKKTSLRKAMTSPQVYIGVDDRLETVMFRNKSKTNAKKHADELRKFESIVYSVYNSSTKYLGTIGDMQ